MGGTVGGDERGHRDESSGPFCCSMILNYLQLYISRSPSRRRRCETVELAEVVWDRLVSGRRRPGRSS